MCCILSLPCIQQHTFKRNQAPMGRMQDIPKYSISSHQLTMFYVLFPFLNKKVIQNVNLAEESYKNIHIGMCLISSFFWQEAL